MNEGGKGVEFFFGELPADFIVANGDKAFGAGTVRV